jgi:phosphoglycolate phosphatase
MNNIRSIIWDWNGTLLDDVDICIETINVSLGNRNLPLLTKNRYREIFTFPVIDYYIKAGFNFEESSFDELSHEFIDLYLEKLKRASLFEDVKEVLSIFRNRGYHQFILSAMEQSTLNDSVRKFHIESFFEKIQGTGDIYAYGKQRNAALLIEKYRMDPHRTCLIGDTLHDLDVATQIGCQCLLVSAGHQSHSRLITKYDRVARKIKDVLSACQPGHKG